MSPTKATLSSVQCLIIHFLELDPASHDPGEVPPWGENGDSRLEESSSGHRLCSQELTRVETPAISCNHHADAM